MRYSEALDYLYTQLPMFQRQGPKAFKKDLTNIHSLMELMDQPQDSWPCIHVAGTNGKGTTSHMMAAMLQAAGYRVGLYTSPHYRDFRERIKINGEYISKSAVKKFVQWYQKNGLAIKASFFEITVAMAFDYFRTERVEIAIIETGLGGRLDSTNVVDPLLSVITNIGLDHTNFLGDTLELIAGEKAGIIKSGRPVVIGRMQAETTQIFSITAKERNAEISFAEELIEFEITSPNNLICKKILNGNVNLENKEIPFYHENLKTALAAMHVLNGNTEFIVTNEDVRTGLIHLQSMTNFIGRWMTLQEKPLTIGDSAHNVDGLKGVIPYLLAYQKENYHFVLGFVNDKVLSAVLALFPADGIYYFAKANIPRGLDANSLMTQAVAYGLHGQAYSSVRKALAAAEMKAGEDDLIFVGGSIFTLAEVI